MRCPACKQRLVTGAKFCHMCGFELPADMVRRSVPWYYEPAFVISTIFLVLAVFGLPLLWKSPRFSSSQKVLISLATFLYTGAVLGLFYYLVVNLFLPYYQELKALA